MGNVGTLLWRTVYIQAVRRRHTYTLMEMATLLFLFAAPFLLSEKLPKFIKELGDILNSTEMVPTRPGILIYGPSSAYHEGLMEAVADELRSKNRTVTLNFFEELLSSFNIDIKEKQLSTDPLVVESVESPDMVRWRCEHVIISNASLKDALCVALYSDGNEEDGSNASLRFTVYMPTDQIGQETKEFPLGSVSETKKLDLAIKYQYLIEKTHVEMQRKMIAEKANIQRQETNYEINLHMMSGRWADNKWSAYRIALFGAIQNWFQILTLQRMNVIEQEFSSGLAEQQCVLGMSAAHLMLGHFLNIMVYEVIGSCLFVPLLYFIQSYAKGIDITLMLFSFFVYNISHAIFIIMFSWLFPTGWLGLINAFLVASIGPEMIDMVMFASVSKYIYAPRKNKLFSGLLPHTGFYSVLRILFLARDYEEGGRAGWSIVSTRVLERDNVTILEIWGVMLVASVVMLFTAWYLPKVAPWASKNPQNLMFCLKPSYWTPSAATQVTESVPVVTDPKRFEEGPPGAEPIVEVNNVTKVYHGFPALNGLSLKLYESRVTVLLGHNGAGKTTLMNILTGVSGATSGTARIFGYDTTTQRDEIRKLISYCPQTDVFFENLTCCENLLYFGSLKGASWAALENTIAETLKLVRLEDKSYSMPSTLSGGMKRRLSLAIAIVSKPKMVILDEPTTGLDAETRRNVWDLIQDLSKEHSILLSSHDMEEAEAIGDRIIVIANGKAVCSGSTAFLKRASGVGYKVSLVKAPGRFNLKDVLAVIHKTEPAAEADSDKTGEVTIALNTLDHHNFPDMFNTLERRSEGLGIEAIGVTAASMKDVYLKVNLDWTPGGKERETAVDEKAIEGLCQEGIKNTTLCRCFRALFTKRLLCLTRSTLFLFVGIVVPLMLQLWIASAMKMPQANLFSCSDTILENGTFPIEVRLGSLFPDSVVLLQDSTAMKASQAFRVLVESEGCSVHVVKDLHNELEQLALEDYGHFMRTYAIAASFEKNCTRGLANPTSVLATPVIFNMLHTAQLRQLEEKPATHISARLAYLKYENADIGETLSLISFFFVMLYWGSKPSLSYSLAFSAFAVFPATERLGRAREVQLMTGVSGWFFVLVNLVFDYLCYMLIIVPWCLIHYCFNNYSLTIAGAIVVTFSVFGPTIIMSCYLIAEMAQTPEGALSIALLLFYVGGTMFGLIGEILHILFNLRWVSYLAPPYGLLSCLVKITMWQAWEDTCADNTNFTNSDVPSLYGFSEGGIGGILAAAAVEAALMYVLMSVLLSGYCTRKPDVIPGSEELKVDDDVEEEMKLVDQLRSSNQFGDYALVAWKLQKRFDNLHAVRGLYLALRRSETFGLLGVNGAGKTTAFDILAGLSPPTFGEAYTESGTLSGSKTQWQSQISYCFQSGGLLDNLTGYEYLYLIGRLRGITESELKDRVDSVLSIADLTPHADKKSGVYSGGNKRKLVISAALLGLPPIVFLDEPYAGVDVVSRTKIFEAIGRVKKRTRTAFVISSHNIEECEISCNRLTIMVQGQMMCLGTVQHLREKYGKGYRLHLMLKHGAASDAAAEAKRFMEAVSSLFPAIKLTDQHKNVFSYHMVKRIPWSELFTKVNGLEKDFALEYAIVGDNTLEQIFLAFAKAKQSF